MGRIGSKCEALHNPVRTEFTKPRSHQIRDVSRIVFNMFLCNKNRQIGPAGIYLLQYTVTFSSTCDLCILKV